MSFRLKDLKRKPETILDSFRAKRTDLMDEIEAKESDVKKLSKFAEEMSILQVR